MTLQQFDNTGFKADMKVIYMENEYLLLAVDFETNSIGLCLPDTPEGDLTWVSYSDVKLLKTEE